VKRFQRFKDMTSDYRFVDSIDRAEKDYLNALEAVEKQNGFVFWNHPGPPGKYDSLTLYKEHKEVIEKGLAPWYRSIRLGRLLAGGFPMVPGL
jgi:hypothetical protein